MVLLPQDLIHKKQLGGQLTSSEVTAFFEAYARGEVADYQVSALLMAIYFRGMSPDETLCLTKLMRDSGERFTWPKELAPYVIDKHSSGGLGDKTSLILVPLCILEGLRVPMIAGRGLGHTGGTLDKLEAIPGFNVSLSPPEAKRQLLELGGFIIGQSSSLTPLDRRLYALRDVTSTVACQPLMIASILSKKLAEGLAGLVMDVKFGSGAFVADEAAALELARGLLAVTTASGTPMTALLTNMNSPLGAYVGNALEVYECLAILAGEEDPAYADTRELSLELATAMVSLAAPHTDPATIKARLVSHLQSGRALECFARLVAAQGGDASSLEARERFRQARFIVDVLPPQPAGEPVYIAAIDGYQLGMSVVALGGGRTRSDQRIDPQVGLVACKKVGDRLEAGEPLATIYANSREQADEACQIIGSAYRLSAQTVPKQPLIAQRLTQKMPLAVPA